MPVLSAAKLFLLLIVIAGFLTEGFRLAFDVPADNAEFLGSAIGRGLLDLFGESGTILGFRTMWWIHALMGCAFIAMITHGPFSHMLLGPPISAFAGKGLRYKTCHRSTSILMKTMMMGTRKSALGRPGWLTSPEKICWMPPHASGADVVMVCPAAQTGKDLSPKKSDGYLCRVWEASSTTTH